jgi:hypothetical protein
MSAFAGMKKSMLPWLLIVCAMGSGTSLAEGPLRASFAVWAVGLPNGYVVMAHQARSIEISEEDVRQGAVYVPAATRLVVVNRSSGSYAVDFWSAETPFRSVRVEGIGHAVEFGAAGGRVVERAAPAGRHAITVDYRFTLAPDAKPGSYPWPLQIAVRHAGQGAYPDAFDLTQRLAMQKRAGP